MLKKIIKHIFSKFGYQILKKLDIVSNNSYSRLMEDGLNRCANRNFKIGTVIDVGASNGMWSKSCMKFYPNSDYFLIEAQEEHTPNLEAFKAHCSNVDFKIVAAGSREGFVLFDNSDLFGGVVLDNSENHDFKKVPVTTIDVEVANNNLKPPFLIKLDTHGYEIPILEGALNTLQKSNIVIIEVYNFVIADNSLRFWEMCLYMDKLGFLPIDLVDVFCRKKDDSLWQFDLFFIKKSSDEFKCNDYD